jgi:hypothetical protein
VRTFSSAKREHVGLTAPSHRRGSPTVAERDGAGTLVAVFVYGSNSDTPDLVVRNNATYRLLTDQVGSVLRAINVANAKRCSVHGIWRADRDHG